MRFPSFTSVGQNKAGSSQEAGTGGILNCLATDIDSAEESIPRAEFAIAPGVIPAISSPSAIVFTIVSLVFCSL
ncbi:MAG: hypothetical protein AAFQ41_05020 [Cyanobacteria bacterium J06623_7]